jgi:glycosyltransferase involved in cell wall biosynthesis
MRILHLNYSNYKGGASRAAYRIHESLIKKKVQSYLLVNIYNEFIYNQNVIGPKNIFFKFLFFLKYFLGTCLAKILFNGRTFKHSLNIFTSSFYNKINNSNFDIIHLHWINGEMLSIKDILLINKPIVWTLHDMWPFCNTDHHSFSTKWKHDYLKKKSFLNVEKFFWKKKIQLKKKKIYIVGVSKWIKDCSSKSFIMKKNPSSIIANTLDTNFWRPIKKNIAKKYYNIPSNFIVLGCGALGSNNFLKGSDLLELALDKIKTPKNNLILLQFGNLNNNLKFFNNIKVINVGELADDKSIKLFYNCLDVFLFPSRLESFGQSAVEANACGVPVVAFKTSGVKDIVVHKFNGWLSKSYDFKDFAKGIDFIINLKKKSYKKLSNNSRFLSKKKFSYNTIASKYINLYKSILNNR